MTKSIVEKFAINLLSSICRIVQKIPLFGPRISDDRGRHKPPSPQKCRCEFLPTKNLQRFSLKRLTEIPCSPQESNIPIHGGEVHPDLEEPARVGGERKGILPVLDLLQGLSGLSVRKNVRRTQTALRDAEYALASTRKGIVKEYLQAGKTPGPHTGSIPGRRSRSGPRRRRPGR